MISVMLQFKALQIFKSVSVVRFSPFPSFANEAVLMPLSSRSCFLLISRLAGMTHNGL